MTEQVKFKARIHHSINDIPRVIWEACANPARMGIETNIPNNPFISYEFLKALEDSGSVTAETGWAPHHISVENEQDQIVGVAPMYLKNHSYGEYVFDWSWADAYHRAGGEYYPKLQMSVPFTPATGRRLLARPDGDMKQTEAQLASTAMQIAREQNISSLHLTFLPKEQWEHLGELGFLKRTDQQFHWLNQGYQNFDEFLESLSSRKRKNLRKERERAIENDITIERLTGDDLKEHHWDAFYRFYQDTGLRKWGQPYLTKEFFLQVAETMPADILLVLCKRNDRYIAGAINFIGSDTLYGRNWGALEDHRFLHFEACYYQAIDFAIERGLKRVEAGAQGAHKLARGYLPTHTYSAHYLPNPDFRRAVENYLENERNHIDQEIDYLGTRSPFKREAPNNKEAD